MARRSTQLARGRAGAPVLRLGRDFAFGTASPTERFVITLDRPAARSRSVWRCSVLTRRRNAALAAQAAVSESSRTCPDDALAAGLTEAHWPGRMEVVRPPERSAHSVGWCPKRACHPSADGRPSSVHRVEASTGPLHFRVRRHVRQGCSRSMMADDRPARPRRSRSLCPSSDREPDPPAQDVAKLTCPTGLAFCVETVDRRRHWRHARSFRWPNLIERMGRRLWFLVSDR